MNKSGDGSLHARHNRSKSSASITAKATQVRPPEDGEWHEQGF